MGFDGSSFNITTGSFINDISASTVEPSDFEVGVIALDPDNSDSFLISSSRAFGDQQTIIYFSGSGPIGIGTTDPKNEVDIKTNSFKIRSRDGSEETEIISGRLITKKFSNLVAADTESLEQSGSQITLTYSPGTFDTPFTASQGDILGTITWEDLSITDRIDATAMQIQGHVDGVSATGDAIKGSMRFGIGESTAGEPIGEKFRIDLSGITVTGSDSGLFIPSVDGNGHITIGSNNNNADRDHHIRFGNPSSQRRFVIGVDNDQKAFAINTGTLFSTNNLFKFSSSGELITQGGITTNGDLTVTGTITAQEFKTEFISSSIIFESGSTQFGNSADDIATFSGSMNLKDPGHITASGNISASGNIIANTFTGTFTGAVTGDATGLTGNPDIFVGHVSASGNVSASSLISQTHITASGNISGSGNLLLGGNADITGSLIVDEDVFVSQYIKHRFDEDTFINFTDDQIRFKAGNIGFFDMEKDGSAPYPATINPGGNRINFRVVDRNTNLLLKTDSEAFKVNLYYAGNQKLETAVGGINVTGNITASGVISSSGTENNIFGGDILLDGDRAITDVTGLGDLDIKPGAKLRLGNANTDVIEIGRQSGTGGVGRTEIYANTSTIAAKFSGSQIIFNHPITASSDISSSGDLTGDEVNINQFINHIGDADTYFGFSANNQVLFHVGGGDRLLINSAGNVGIGTTSPPEKLTVTGNISASGDITASGLFITGSTSEFNRTGGATKGDIFIPNTTAQPTIEFGRLSGVSGDSSTFKFRSRLDQLKLEIDTAGSGDITGKFESNANGKFILQRLGGDNKELFVVNEDGGHVTASGDISASGTIFTPKVSFNNGDITLDNSSGNILEFDGGHMRFKSNVEARFGSSDVFRISSDNTDGDIRSSGDLKLRTTSADGDILLQSGSTTMFSVDGGLGRNKSFQHLQMSDGKALYAGNGLDLGIYHLSNNSYIENLTGDLNIINSSGDDIKFLSGSTEFFRVDGGAGISVVSKEMRFADNIPLKLGNGPDFSIVHDTSNTTFTNNLALADIKFLSGSTEFLRFDGAESKTIFSQPIRLNDNVRLNFGDQDDLVLRHNGTDAFISNGTGDLKIINNQDNGDIIFQSDDGDGDVTEYITLDGGDTSTRIHTNVTASGNISASGNVIAPQFHIGGDGVTPPVFLTHHAAGDNLQIVNGGLLVQNNITASGDISASGDVFGNEINAAGSLAKLHSDGKVEARTIFTFGTNSTDGFIRNASTAGDISIEPGTTSGILTLKSADTTSLVINKAHVTASGNISASGTITAASFVGSVTGDATGLTGTPDITVGDIIATSLNVTSITSSIVTSSILKTEGSNIFGDTSDDTHTFNGNITASGNISASGNVLASNVFIDSKLEHIGDSNTFLEFQGDFVKIAAGGGESKSIVNNNGNIGIGISSPSEKLQVEGNISSSGAINTLSHITASGDISSSGTVTSNKILVKDAYAAELNVGSAGPKIHLGTVTDTDNFMTIGAFSSINNIDTNVRDFHLFGTNTTTGFYFDESAGKFGIGTTTPQHVLELRSSIPKLSFSSSNNTGGSILFSDNLSTGTEIQGTQGNIIFKKSSTENVRITSAGKVGIGTTVPPEKLTVEGNISASGHISSSGLYVESSTITDFIKLNSLGSSANPIKLIFEKAASEQGIIEYNRNGDLEIYNTDGDGGVMIDGSTSAGGDLYVANSGKVGIGTTTPPEKLTVEGNISASGDLILEGGATASTDIHVGQFIYHDGDLTNYHRFINNKQIFVVGNDSSINLDNGVSTFGVATKSTTLQGSPILLLGDISASGHVTASGNISGSSTSTFIIGGAAQAGSYKISNVTVLSGATNVTLGSSGATGTISLTTHTSTPFKIENDDSITISSPLSSSAAITASNSQFGSGGKIEITHSGGAGVIDSKTANLNIKTSANERISLSPAGAESLTVAHGGNVGIGTNNPSSKLTVAGNISSSGNIIATQNGTGSFTKILAGGATSFNESSTQIQANNGVIDAGNTGVVRAQRGKFNIINNRLNGQDIIEFTSANNVNILGPISASNNISSSGGVITGEHISASGNVSIGKLLELPSGTGGIKGINLGTFSHIFESSGLVLDGGTGNRPVKLRFNGNDALVVGVGSHVTASNNISASGDFEGNSYQIQGKSAITYNSGNTRIIYGQNNQNSRLRGATITLGDDTTQHITASGNVLITGSSDLVLDAGSGIIGPPTFTIISQHSNRGRIDLFSSTGHNASQVKLYGGSAGLELQRDTGVEITGDITASNNISASGTVTANSFVGGLTGDATGLIGNPNIFVGNISASGNITATGTITAQEFKTEFISSSIIFESGSTQFGNSEDDIATFSGSINVKDPGHISASGNISASGKLRSTGLEFGHFNNFLNFTAGGTANTFKYNEWKQSASGGTTINNTAGTINFDSKGNADTMVISGSSVGIGTTTPGELLHVAGNITLGNNKKITFRDSSGNDGTSIAYDSNALFKITQANSGELRLNAGFNDNSNNKITFLTQGSSERMRITNDGNVGIGLTEPARKFHIHESSGTAYLQLTHASNGSGSSDGFQISMGASQVNLINRENGNMVFETNNTEGMRLNNSQNLGIGNNNPPEKLTVTGNISSSGAIHTLSHISSSGNISASSFTSQTHITASGNISSSGNLSASNAFLGGGRLDLGNGVSIFQDGSNILRTDDVFHANGDIHISDRLVNRSQTGNYIEFATNKQTFNVDQPTFTGNITASGNISASGTGTHTLGGNVKILGLVTDLPSSGQLRWGSGDAEIREGLDDNYSLSLRTYDGSGLSTALKLYGDNRAEFSSSITASGNIVATGSGNIISSNEVEAGSYFRGRNGLQFRNYDNTWNAMQMVTNGKLELAAGGANDRGEIYLHSDHGSTPRTGIVAFENEAQQVSYLFTDASQSLKFHTSDPGEDDSVGYVVGVPKVELFTVTSSGLIANTTMALPNSLTYMTSSEGYEYLEIFADGIRLNRTIDYSEISTSSVRYLVSIPSESIITYKSLRTV